jgi:hypothetical protein
VWKLGDVLLPGGFELDPRACDEVVASRGSRLGRSCVFSHGHRPGPERRDPRRSRAMDAQLAPTPRAVVPPIGPRSGWRWDPGCHRRARGRSGGSAPGSSAARGSCAARMLASDGSWMLDLARRSPACRADPPRRRGIRHATPAIGDKVVHTAPVHMGPQQAAPLGGVAQTRFVWCSEPTRHTLKGIPLGILKREIENHFEMGFDLSF